MPDSPIATMSPQPWPLIAVTEDRSRFFVLGWSPAGAPVGVLDGTRSNAPMGAAPELLTEPVRYVLPGLNVSVEGEVSASVDGSVNASVTGPSLNDAVKIVNVDY